MTKQIIPLPPSVRKDLTGQQFGHLTVMGYTGTNNSRCSMWYCKCDCGGESVVRGSNLLNGATKSCGCQAGYRKHGMTNTPEFRVWEGMIRRCRSENRTYYHGRGIKVCPRWLDSFEAFYTDMGPRPSKRHTIDRIDNDGDYTPENCRWATSSEQNNNQRRNRWISMNGHSHTLAQWCAILGINPSLVSTRIRRGWSPEKALTENKRRYG